jgi:thiol-disulfide isomerase/thioredoxin
MSYNKMSVYHLSSSSFTVAGGETVAAFHTEADTILFIHAKWCGYCKQAVPEFKKAAIAVGDSGVKFAMLEDVELKKMEKPLPVRGFPSFFRIDGKTGKITALDGFPRTADAMLKAI